MFPEKNVDSQVVQVIGSDQNLGSMAVSGVLWRRYGEVFWGSVLGSRIFQWEDNDGIQQEWEYLDAEKFMGMSWENRS